MWVHFLQKGKFEGGTSCLSCISLCIYYVYEYRDFLWYIHLDQTDLKVTAAGDGESPKNLKQRQDQLLHLEGCCGSNKNRFKGQGHLGDAFRNPGKGYRFENEMIDKFDDSSLLSTCTVTILAWPSSFLLSPTPDSSSYLCSWPSSIHPSHQTERHIWQSRSPAYNTSHFRDHLLLHAPIFLSSFSSCLSFLASFFTYSVQILASIFWHPSSSLLEIAFPF